MLKRETRTRKGECELVTEWQVILTLPLRFISATLAYTLPVLAGDDGCDLVD